MRVEEPRAKLSPEVLARLPSVDVDTAKAESMRDWIQTSAITHICHHFPILKLLQRARYNSLKVMRWLSRCIYVRRSPHPGPTGR